jgi:hypothetical protein
MLLSKVIDPTPEDEEGDNVLEQVLQSAAKFAMFTIIK